MREGASLRAGEAISLKFGDQVTRQAVVDAGPEAAPAPAPKPVRAKEKPPTNQGDLF